MEIMTVRQARERGLHKYYDGKDCRNGHHALRYAETGACTACISAYGRANRGRPGVVLVKNWVHPDDTQALNDLAAALNMARTFK